MVAIGGFLFGIALEHVAGVTTLDQASAARLDKDGVFAWNGESYHQLRIPGLETAFGDGDTAVLLEMTPPRVLTCQPRFSYQGAAKRLALPRTLTRRYPWVQDAFLSEAGLVYCLELNFAEVA